MVKVSKKLKILIPALRVKKRYILFEIISKEKLSKKDVFRELEKAMTHFLGLLGYAHAGIIFIDFNEKTKKGIIKVNHRYVNEIKSSFIYIDKIKNENIIIKSVKTSGILKKLLNLMESV